jgi:uncharacterized OB-fold protein
VGQVIRRKRDEKIVGDRECECGAPLAPRHRYCAKCAPRKARAAARDRKVRQRRTGVTV